jgi:hypothetical protein
MQITIHTVEVVGRHADGTLIPGTSWTIVSADSEANIERRFTRERYDVLDDGEYFTAHRVPGTATLIDAEA